MCIELFRSFINGIFSKTGWRETSITSQILTDLSFYSVVGKVFSIPFILGEFTFRSYFFFYKYQHNPCLATQSGQNTLLLICNPAIRADRWFVGKKKEGSKARIVCAKKEIERENGSSIGTNFLILCIYWNLINKFITDCK